MKLVHTVTLIECLKQDIETALQIVNSSLCEIYNHRQNNVYNGLGEEKNLKEQNIYDPV